MPREGVDRERLRVGALAQVVIVKRRDIIHRRAEVVGDHHVIAALGKLRIDLIGQAYEQLRLMVAKAVAHSRNHVARGS